MPLINDNILQFGGTLLTVLTLALSIWQLLAAKKQTRKLSEIGDSLSTRFLEEFPNYLPTLAKLIDEAQSEVLIVSAFPAPGVFSCPEGLLRLSMAIQLARHRGISVSCVFADPEHRIALTSDPFRQAVEDWPNWREQPDKALLIDDFLSRFAPELGRQDVTGEQFLELIEKSHVKQCAEIYNHCMVKPIRQRPSLYAWVVDKRKAIFGIATTSPNYTVYAFYTEDERMLRALIDMHNEYIEKRL